MTQNNNYTNFLKFAAICSVLGAITTILAIFLPTPETTGVDSKALLHQNILYLSKLWILFIHPQVNIIASLGIASLLLHKKPLQIIVGTFFLIIWAYTEMSQQALLIDALNQYWRPGYLGAENETIKTTFLILIEGVNGISDSKYFLVIYGFGLGSMLYGFAFITELGIGKWIGTALIFIGLLTVLSFIRYYLGVAFLSPVVNWCYEWIYPYLQPLVRIAIGVWIYKQIAVKHHKTAD